MLSSIFCRINHPPGKQYDSTLFLSRKSVDLRSGSPAGNCRAGGHTALCLQHGRNHRRARAFRQAAGKEALVCYAVKANGNLSILKLLKDEGLGADVTSGGELFLALQAGIAPESIIYSGVGKRDDEIEMALNAGIGALNVESAMEFERVAGIAARLKREAPIAVRVNPDISAETHPYDSTGRLVHKFGVPRDTAVSLYQRAARHPWLRPVGLAAHIGSQITELQPYRELVTFLLELAGELAGRASRSP